jgi:hypothetical protein
MQNHLVIPENYRVRNKVRGSKRKLRSLGSKIDSIFGNVTNESFAHDKILHYRLPSPTKLVDSTNSSCKLRKRFLRLLIDHLIELDGMIKDKYRTLLFVSLPFLSHSRIDLCIDEKYFEKLINNAEWTPMKPERNIVRELNLSMPKEYGVKGYLHSTEEYWFIWKNR